MSNQLARFFARTSFSHPSPVVIIITIIVIVIIINAIRVASIRSRRRRGLVFALESRDPRVFIAPVMSYTNYRLKFRFVATALRRKSEKKYFARDRSIQYFFSFFFFGVVVVESVRYFWNLVRPAKRHVRRCVRACGQSIQSNASSFFRLGESRAEVRH